MNEQKGNDHHLTRDALAPRPSAELARAVSLQQLGVEGYGGSLATLNGKTIHVREVGMFLSRRFDSGCYFIARIVNMGTGEAGEWQRYSSFATPVKRIVAALMEGQDHGYRELDPPLSVRVSTAGETYELI